MVRLYCGMRSSWRSETSNYKLYPHVHFQGWIVSGFASWKRMRSIHRDTIPWNEEIWQTISRDRLELFLLVSGSRIFILYLILRPVWNLDLNTFDRLLNSLPESKRREAINFQNTEGFSVAVVAVRKSQGADFCRALRKRGLSFAPISGMYFPPSPLYLKCRIS